MKKNLPEVVYPLEVVQKYNKDINGFQPYVRVDRSNLFTVTTVDDNHHWHPVPAELHNKLIEYLYGE